MDQSPDKSLGSVLVTGFGCISGLSARMSNSSLLLAGAAGSTVFFPKILESNVAIVNFSLQRCSLGVCDENGQFLARCNVSFNVNFVIAARSTGIPFLDQYVLYRAGQSRALRLCDPVYE